MNIVFCADRGVLPGLHVAAFSLLERMNPTVQETRFTIFSEVFDESDMTLLRETLNATAKPFRLDLRRVEASAFAGFPALNGSWATYHRLQATQVMDVDRFLYVDADTLCDVDVGELNTLEMGKMPAGWVPEAPLVNAVDRGVAEQLGNSDTEFYFNAGVMLVNVAEWQRQNISQQAMEYIARHRPAFHDQSALNCVLHYNAIELDEKFNCMSNMRKNWCSLKRPYGKIGRLVHFLDYPKPWDLLGEWLHPQYRLWRAVLNRTAMRDFRSWHNTPARKFPQTGKAWAGYKKVAKDRLLFAGYARGWLKNIKGVTVKAKAESRK